MNQNKLSFGKIFITNYIINFISAFRSKIVQKLHANFSMLVFLSHANKKFFLCNKSFKAKLLFWGKKSMLAFAKIIAIKGVNEGFSVIIWNRHHSIPDGCYFYITIICQDFKINQFFAYFPPQINKWFSSLHEKNILCLLFD